MIELRIMNPDEYKEIIPTACDNYIKELEVYEAQIQQNMKISAKEFGQQQLNEVITNGLDSPNQSFWVLIKSKSNQIYSRATNTPKTITIAPAIWWKRCVFLPQSIFERA